MIFSARALSRRYSRGDTPIHALDGVDLDIEAGAVVGVCGPSGSGKSTLANVLGLLDGGFEGELRFRDTPVGPLGQSARATLRLSQIGFVFQNFQLLSMLDVRDNVALPRWRLRGDRREACRAADELLERLGLGHRASHDPNRLSGGEMQRVAVARALINDPVAIVADEPTGNLDSKNAIAVLDALLGARSERRTVVLVSHDETVLARADRVITLADGQIRSVRADPKK